VRLGTLAAYDRSVGLEDGDRAGPGQVDPRLRVAAGVGYAPVTGGTGAPGPPAARSDDVFPGETGS